jgi:hypothetical protein
MVRAGAVRMRKTRYLQIKGLHDAKSSAGQLLIDPAKNAITSLIKNQERH